MTLTLRWISFLELIAPSRDRSMVGDPNRHCHALMLTEP
jgi:hypothetical protein